MIKIAAIAKWEINRRLSSRMYVVSLFLTPLLLFGITYAPLALRSGSAPGTHLLLCIDAEGTFVKKMAEYAGAFGADRTPEFVVVRIAAADTSTISARISAGEASAAVMVNRADGSIVILHPPHLTDADVLAIRTLCMLAARATGPLPVITQQAADTGSATHGARGAVFFLMLLFFTVTFAGGTFARSLLEEKSSKLADLLLSSCSVEQLLWGKTAGIGVLTLLQVVLWGTLGTITAGSGVFGSLHTAGIVISSLFFVSGFVLYVSVFTGIGASLKQESEVQTVFVYLSLLLLVPLLASGYIEQHPHSAVTEILQYFPLFTPSVQIIKIAAGTATATELIISLLLISAGIVFFTRFSGAAFRRSILQQEPQTRKLLRNILRRQH